MPCLSKVCPGTSNERKYKREKKVKEDVLKTWFKMETTKKHIRSTDRYWNKKGSITNFFCKGYQKKCDQPNIENKEDSNVSSIFTKKL